jgi:hypothetical protein
LRECAEEVRLTLTHRVVVEPRILDRLVDALRGRGYRVLGPTVRDGAIVYDDLESAGELPIGWTDRQDGGSYRLERRADDARFGYAVGPHSWKRFLFPPRVRLWRASRNGDGAPAVEEEPLDEPPLAFIGVRSCELHAIEIQDRVFIGGTYVDRDYAARREGAFLVAVNCHEPGDTCFCTSMGTGPEVRSGYDLALTELLDGEHRFLVEAGTDRGEEVLAELAGRAAVDADLAAKAASVEVAAGRMGRTMETFDRAEPGTLHRVDAGAGPVPASVFRSSSTHAFGVGEAVELARALGTLPGRLALYGIEGAEFVAGEGLSAEVQAAVEPAAQAVLEELEQLRREEEEPCTSER